VNLHSIQHIWYQLHHTLDLEQHVICWQKVESKNACTSMVQYVLAKFNYNETRDITEKFRLHELQFKQWYLIIYGICWGRSLLFCGVVTSSRVVMSCYQCITVMLKCLVNNTSRHLSPVFWGQQNTFHLTSFRGQIQLITWVLIDPIIINFYITATFCM